MSKFKKMATRLEALKEDIPANIVDKKSFDTADNELKGFEKDMNRFVTNAKETDPDMKLYGPKMIAKILAANTLFEELKLSLENLRASINEAALPEQERLAAEARRIAEEHAAAEREYVRQEEAKRMQLAQEREQQLAALKAEEDAKAAAEAEAAAALAQQREQYDAKLDVKREASEAAAEGDLDAVLQILQTQTNDTEFIKTVQFLNHIVSNLLVEFSDERGRHLKKDNDKVKECILAHVAGPECLHSLGFIDREVTKAHMSGQFFVLPEPEVTDLDAYTAQMNVIEEAASILEGYLE